jgi:hypothetical protein
MATPDHETIRHYIDKLFAAHLNLAIANGRILLIMLVLSVVLLGVSGGIASTEGKLAVAGFGVKVPLVVFLTSAAVFLGVLAATRPSAFYHERLYTHEINRLYRDIGFRDRTQTGRRVYPLRTTSVVYPILQSLRPEHFPGSPSERDRNDLAERIFERAEKIFELLVWFTYAVLPMAAVIGTGFKVAELLRESKLGWVWIFFILWALVSCAFAWLLRRQTIREESKLDNSLDAKRISRGFAIGLLMTFLVGGVIGFFVAKVLGSP